jgi:hypothetical protein
MAVTVLCRAVDNDLVGMGNLKKRRTLVAVLATDFLSAFCSEASGALYLLLRRDRPV